MKLKKIKKVSELAQMFDLPESRGLEAEIKALLIKSIIDGMKDKELTHQELANMSGLSRTTITGIVNNSLQKVTIDRLLKIIFALGYSVDLKVRKSA